MLDFETAKEYNIFAKMDDNLLSPYFSDDLPLWSKNTSASDCGCPINAKRYTFTKLGKTLGLEVTRYMSVWGSRLYYFETPNSQLCLGTCELENVYLRWLAVAKDKYLLLLYNGNESSKYIFESSAFYDENWRALARYVVQVGFYNQFQILQELGEGAFSTVFRVVHQPSGQQLSAKQMPIDTPRSYILRELEVLRELVGAQHVCQYWGLYENNQTLVLLTNYVEGRDLMTVINYSATMSKEDIRTIVSGIGKGLKECHKKKIIHRDIKPQNIVVNLDTMEPTIIDFGMALNLKKQCEFKKCGTLAYMAPEVFKCEHQGTPYNTKSDWFSLGVIAHIMMMGQNPLKGKEGQPFDRNHEVALNQQKLKAKWSDNGLEMVAGMLKQNPCRRWCADKVLSCQFLLGQQEWKKSDSYSTIEDRHFFSSC